MRDHHGARSADGVETTKQSTVSTLREEVLRASALMSLKLRRFESARPTMGIPARGYTSS
jgi:hypothetical protein